MSDGDILSVLGALFIIIIFVIFVLIVFLVAGFISSWFGFTDLKWWVLTIVIFSFLMSFYRMINRIGK